MSVTALIRDEICWGLKSYYFDGVIRLIADEIRDLNPATAALLLEPVELPILVLDLTPLEEEQFQELAHAARRAYSKAISQPAIKRFTEPSRRFDLMRSFSELKALLLGDPRIKEKPGTVFTIQGNTRLKTPAWQGDLILEIAAAHILCETNNAEWAKTLTDSRGYDGTGHCDLRQVSSTHLCEMCEGINWLYERCTERGIPRISSDSFYEDLAPVVTELRRLLLTDQRTRDCQ